MPSLTALAGRAGAWDGAFMSGAELRMRGKNKLLLQLQHKREKRDSRQGDKVLG